MSPESEYQRSILSKKKNLLSWLSLYNKTTRLCSFQWSKKPLIQPISLFRHFTYVRPVQRSRKKFFWLWGRLQDATIAYYLCKYFRSQIRNEYLYKTRSATNYRSKLCVSFFWIEILSKQFTGGHRFTIQRGKWHHRQHPPSTRTHI